MKRTPAVRLDGTDLAAYAVVAADFERRTELCDPPCSRVDVRSYDVVLRAYPHALGVAFIGHRGLRNSGASYLIDTRTMKITSVVMSS